METLKFEDLMCNDIVLAEAVWFNEETGDDRVEWHPFLITDISSKCCLFCGDVEEGGFIGEWIDDCDAEEIRELKGMPLTEEILKANGWKHTGGEGRFEYNIGGTYGTTLWFETDKYTLCANEYNAEEEGFDRLIWLRHVRYVHQIQDALRVCGLKKFANNFNIKPAYARIFAPTTAFFSEDI